MKLSKTLLCWSLFLLDGSSAVVRLLSHSLGALKKPHQMVIYAQLHQIEISQVQDASHKYHVIHFIPRVLYSILLNR